MPIEQAAGAATISASTDIRPKEMTVEAQTRTAVEPRTALAKKTIATGIETSSPPDITDAEVEPLLSAFKTLTGITIPVQKKVMVVYRLKRRMAELGQPSMAVYLEQVSRERPEQQKFINMLTTNETSFFRTQRVWRFFTETFLPEFHAKGKGMLRAWSAAASTGEEAYSIAMACLDFQPRNPGFQFQITASDVDTSVLAHAEKGFYPDRRMEKLLLTHPELVRRYFRTQPGGSVAGPGLRNSVQFRRHNLMEPSRSMVGQSVVFLRNALIYFKEEEQTRILRLVAQVMPPGGVLFLGESESIVRLPTAFKLIEPMVYRKVG